MTKSHKLAQAETSAEAMIDRMAQIMVEAGEGVTDNDLRMHGFTQTEINDFGLLATQQATAAATHEVA